VTALLPLLLLSVLVLCGAVAFAPLRLRNRLRWTLRLAVLLCWGAVGLSLWQSASRTAVTLVSPGPARRPDMIDSALGQAATLLVSLGGPAALVTALALWALRTTRPGADDKGPARARPKGLKIEPLKAPPAKDLDEVVKLFEEYARALDLDPKAPEVAAESAALPGPYGPPQGKLLLARVGGQVAGCIAVQVSPAGAGSAELRRLFVRPQFRHAGVGRTLAEAGLLAASGLGYSRARVETLPAMREGLQLFRALGFQEVPAQKDAAAGATWLEKPLV
jgi:carbonic anhydrase